MTVMDVVTEEMTIVKEIMANCQELKLQDQQKSPTWNPTYKTNKNRRPGNPTELSLHNMLIRSTSLRPVEKKIPFSSL